MRGFMKTVGLILIVGVVMGGCDSLTDSVSEENADLQTAEGITASSSHCLSTGAGLTANYINEVPNGSFDVTCDIGIYFDEDNKVKRAAINGTVAGAKSKQYGIYVNGADVDISNLTVIVDEDYPHQFVSVSYYDGATGNISKSELTGAHRVGLIVRGEGTDVTARGNQITGTGAKTSGWAENGIQIDQGAKADIKNNTVEGHWWDGESNFGSTGILLYGTDNSSVVNNTLTDNEFTAYIIGDDNSFKSNKVRSDVVSESSLNFKAYGALVSGSGNDLSGNRMIATNGAVGIFVFPTSDKNKITGNRISGFDFPIYDGGDDTLERGNPSVFN